MATSKITKAAAIVGILVSITGIAYKIHQILLENEKHYEESITAYEGNVRSIKIKNKKFLKPGDTICVANLTKGSTRITIKYNALDGNWLLEGTVPFGANEINYLDAYTNNRQVYINCQRGDSFYYNNELPTDTVSEKVTKKIPFLFLIGNANPNKNLYDIKLYGVGLDKNNNLIIADKKLSERDFSMKRDSVNNLKK